MRIQMIKYSPLIYLLFLLNFNTSCADNPSSDKHLKEEADTLKFTSGIRSILQDSKGNYWFGSHNEGVALFNGDSFSYFTTDDGLFNNQVRSLQEDKKGVIWFGTANGVNSYDFSQPGKINKYSSLKLEPGIWAKSDQDLWFNAGNKEGVYRYDGKDLHYLVLPKTNLVGNYNNHVVTCFSKGSRNRQWIGTYSAVFSFDGKDFSIIENHTIGLDGETKSLHVRSLLEDSKGRLWIGNNGIGVLLKEGDSIINFSEKMKLVPPTSTRRGSKSPPGTLEHIFSITEDLAGNIWFGDRDAGVWKYDGETMTNYTTKDGLSEGFAQCIYLDKKGVLWFGLSDGNVFTFNGKTFEKRF